jgi:hypothetical protein
MSFLWQPPIYDLVLFIFFFFAILGFELRASHLLVRHSTTWASPLAYGLVLEAIHGSSYLPAKTTQSRVLTGWVKTLWCATCQQDDWLNHPATVAFAYKEHPLPRTFRSNCGMILTHPGYFLPQVPSKPWQLREAMGYQECFPDCQKKKKTNRSKVYAKWFLI